MDSHIGYSIGIIVVFLILSAYFSATETAFTSINRIRMKNLANDGDRRAKRVLELEEKYDNLLSTILIGNNLVNIGMTAGGYRAVSHALSEIRRIDFYHRCHNCSFNIRRNLTEKSCERKIQRLLRCSPHR